MHYGGLLMIQFLARVNRAFVQYLFNVCVFIEGLLISVFIHFRLMNNEAMSGMNMNGNGDKIAFGKTTIFQLITGT